MLSFQPAVVPLRFTMASKQARKLARVALGLADRGGVSKDMQAAMESEEKAFEKRLEVNRRGQASGAGGLTASGVSLSCGC